MNVTEDRDIATTQTKSSSSLPCYICAGTDRPTVPTETRTYRVLFQRDGGDSLLLLVDGHDMAGAMAYSPLAGGRAVFATEIRGSARPLGVRRG